MYSNDWPEDDEAAASFFEGVIAEEDLNEVVDAFVRDFKECITAKILREHTTEEEWETYLKEGTK